MVPNFRRNINRFGRSGLVPAVLQERLKSWLNFLQVVVICLITNVPRLEVVKFDHFQAIWLHQSNREWCKSPHHDITLSVYVWKGKENLRDDYGSLFFCEVLAYALPKRHLLLKKASFARFNYELSIYLLVFFIPKLDHLSDHYIILKIWNMADLPFLKARISLSQQDRTL